MQTEQWPVAYSCNTAVEDALLRCADEFAVLYHRYYPSRPPQLLSAYNEAGQRKFICSFVRPSLTPYSELYSLDTCSAFVAGYMRYVPLLHEPSAGDGGAVREQLPTHITSPATALARQCGNCLEMALVLTSLLTGAGYRAYVVVGYARRAVCMNNQQARMWDDRVLAEAGDEADEGSDKEGTEHKDGGGVAASGVQLDEEYAALLRPAAPLRRASDGAPYGNKAAAAAVGDATPSLARQQATQQRDDSEGDSEQLLDTLTATLTLTGGAGTAAAAAAGLRDVVRCAHAWVLVLPGGRVTQKEATFVEPSTGQCVALADADQMYVAVEAVFDHTQYYVNLHPSVPASALLLDLRNGAQWERVLLTGKDASGDADDTATSRIADHSMHGNVSTAASARRGTSESTATAVTATTMTAGAALGGAAGSSSVNGLGAAAAAAASMTTTTTMHNGVATAAWLSGMSDAAHHDASLATASAAAAAAACGNAAATAALAPLIVPRSWVSELTLSPAQYAQRYPGGSKEVHYANAHVTQYAEYTQPDLRVMEVVVPDTLCHDTTQLHIFYRHRADKLRHRCVLPSTGTLTPQATAMHDDAPYRRLQEWYEHGSTHGSSGSVMSGLRRFVHEPGQRRVMYFYAEARRDGLRKRIELLRDEQTLRKVKEYYTGRTDGMYYRSATYAPPHTAREAAAHASYLGVEASDAGERARLDPARMSQRFARRGGAAVAAAGTRHDGNTKDRVNGNDSGSDDGGAAARRDVAKMTFLRQPPYVDDGEAGEMWLHFQHAPGSLLQPCHMFAKPSSSVDDYIAAAMSRQRAEPAVRVVTVPGATAPSELTLYEERKWLEAAEVSCAAALLATASECRDILVARTRAQSEVQGVLSNYDTLRKRPSETETQRAQRLAERARCEASRRDYLAPYIARLNVSRSFDGNYLDVTLTTEQARQVREAALQDLKERLIQRGRIMQDRMDREKDEFARRQAAYQKSCEVGTIDSTTSNKDTDAFAAYCKEATWRMKVLDERLAKHIDLASEKYAQLAQRLADDPRLAALYTTMTV